MVSRGSWKLWKILEFFVAFSKSEKLFQIVFEKKYEPSTQRPGQMESQVVVTIQSTTFLHL